MHQCGVNGCSWGVMGSSGLLTRIAVNRAGWKTRYPDGFMEYIAENSNELLTIWLRSYYGY